MRLLFIVGLITLLLGGVTWYFLPSTKAARAARALEDFHKKGDKTFKWGIGINEYPTNVVHPEIPGKVLDDAVKAEVSWVRFDVPGWGEDQLALAELTVEAALKRKLHVALGFNPIESIVEVKEPYKDGYERGFEIARRFKGKVRYYQISNEIGSNAIKPSWPGDTIESYDRAKYEQVLAWGKGASDGVRAADPDAKRVFTGNWITYGFFDEAIKDGLEFEVLGWDWYGGADGNYDLSKVNANNTTLDLGAKLKSFGKELWITEAGAEEGSLHGEERQARAIKDFATYVAQSKVFNGFFPFRLHDESHKFGTNEEKLGFINLQRREDGTFELAQPKQAFHTYKALIEQFKNLPAVR